MPSSGFMQPSISNIVNHPASQQSEVQRWEIEDFVPSRSLSSLIDEDLEFIPLKDHRSYTHYFVHRGPSFNVLNTPHSSLVDWNEDLPQFPHLSSDVKKLTTAISICHRDYQDWDKVPYEHIRYLGHGGSAVVDEVRDTCQVSPTRGAPYARKTIKIPTYASPNLHERIQNEISIIKSLSGAQHFIQIVETYTEKRKFVIIMSPVADLNLEEYMDHVRKPSVEDPMYTWFGCLAAGLEYLHAKMIRHRDIKPANILVKNGSVVFADFGIAKDLTGQPATSTIGYVDAKSPMYCAPEVASEASRGRPSDVFSLGCVFLEMVTTLMWSYDLSIEGFSKYRTTDGRQAYHANLEKTLRWILSLFSHSNTRGIQRREHLGLGHTSVCFPLEWSSAMLQPFPALRPTAVNLGTLIGSVNQWQNVQQACQLAVHEIYDSTSISSFTGPCCLPIHSQQSACSLPSLFKKWPQVDSSLVLSGEVFVSWTAVNDDYGYNPVPPVCRRLVDTPDITPQSGLTMIQDRLGVDPHSRAWHMPNKYFGRKM
ncbi:MAG: hypothetical protein M1827_005144 [Pycnora praestabilis]|nr:MAG: hypothetical protein M1827_005144 [Pycnora praestabilis]